MPLAWAQVNRSRTKTHWLLDRTPPYLPVISSPVYLRRDHSELLLSFRAKREISLLKALSVLLLQTALPRNDAPTAPLFSQRDRGGVHVLYHIPALRFALPRLLQSSG